MTVNRLPYKPSAADRRFVYSVINDSKGSYRYVFGFCNRVNRIVGNVVKDCQKSYLHSPVELVTFRHAFTLMLSDYNKRSSGKY